MERGLARYNPSSNRFDLIESGAKAEKDMVDREKLFDYPALSGFFSIINFIARH